MSEGHRPVRAAPRPRKQEAAKAPDDSPQARLRNAAARLNAEGEAGAAPRQPASPRVTAHRPVAAGAHAEPSALVRARHAPPAAVPTPDAAPREHAPAPLLAPPAAYPPPPTYAERPVPAWGGSSSAPASAPPKVENGHRSRLPLVGGVVVALVVVVALIVVGLVSLLGSDAGEPATSARAADRPIIAGEALYSLSGYTFADLPAGSLDVARSPFNAMPELKGTLSDLSGRTLRRDGNAVAAVLIYQFTAAFMSEPSRPDAFLQGITVFAAEAEEVDVGAERGVYYRVGNSLRGLAVQKGNVVVLVQGPLSASRTSLQQIAVGLIGNVP